MAAEPGPGSADKPPPRPNRKALSAGRPGLRAAAPLTVCSCSSARARGRSTNNSAAAAATPGAPGSGLILRGPAGQAPAHRLLRRRRRGRFASTGRGQKHGTRSQPLALPRRRRRRPLPSLPAPGASEVLPLTQPRHSATPAHAGNASRRRRPARDRGSSAPPPRASSARSPGPEPREGGARLALAGRPSRGAWPASQATSGPRPGAWSCGTLARTLNFSWS